MDDAVGGRAAVLTDEVVDDKHGLNSDTKTNERSKNTEERIRFIFLLLLPL